MKETIYENILNKERFRCADARNVEVIDGVEFLKVIPQGAFRQVLIRKDTLKKVNDKKK